MFVKTYETATQGVAQIARTATRLLRPQVWVVLCLLGVLAFPRASVHASTGVAQSAPPAVLRCEPSGAIGRIGAPDVVVDLVVDASAGLSGVDITAGYDASMAQVVDQSPASGVQIEALAGFSQPDSVVRNSVDLEAGTIQFAATRVAPLLPVEGGVAVARITFHGLAAGSFAIALLDVQVFDRDGLSIPATIQPCSVTFLAPLTITLISFDAADATDHVLIRWETGLESGNQGFNLYRGNSPAAPQQQVNSALILSQASGGTLGHVYLWRDYAVQPQHTYYYWLEDVSVTGATGIHGPVSVSYQDPSAVRLSGLSAGSNRSFYPGSLDVFGLAVGLAWPLSRMVRRARNPR